MKNRINYILLILLISNLSIAQNTKALCTATIITESQEICDDFFQVSAEAPEAGETGLWEGPSGTSFADPNASVTFVTGLASGPNIIRCSIFDAARNLCDTDSITLTNNEVITTPIIVTQSYEVCDENGIKLTAMPPTAPGEYGVWSSDNDMITFSPNDSSPNVTVNNLAPGKNIFFWEIRNEECTTNPASITIINNEVLTNANIEISSITEACDSNNVEGVYANLFSYQLLPGEMGTWTGPPGATFSPNAESPTISGLQLGPNLLIWTISRGNCAVSSDSITLNLLDCEVSVENPVFKELNITPNPATSIVNLSKTMTNVQLHVYSIMGQKIISDDNFSGSQINIEALPNGVYFIVIYGQDNYLVKMMKG